MKAISNGGIVYLSIKLAGAKCHDESRTTSSAGPALPRTQSTLNGAAIKKCILFEACEDSERQLMYFNRTFCILCTSSQMDVAGRYARTHARPHARTRTHKKKQTNTLWGGKEREPYRNTFHIVFPPVSRAGRPALRLQKPPCRPHFHAPWAHRRAAFRRRVPRC